MGGNCRAAKSGIFGIQDTRQIIDGKTNYMGNYDKKEQATTLYLIL